MSVNEPPVATTTTTRLQRMPRWYTGRSELIVVAGVLLLAVGLTIGIVTMRVPEGTAFPGPQFFPIIVAVFLYGVAIALAIEVLVSPKRAHAAGETTEVSTDMLEDLGGLDATSEIRVVAPETAVAAPSDTAQSRLDWRTVGITVAALVVFILILEPVGWLVSAALLFWLLTWAFGSRRPLFDIGVAVITSSIIQIAFGAGLGLSLPAGILGGIF
ncbi:tripartite tricarboxylate transporter TctB family protein [Microbacterium sp. No. 7]|uniref:tripartite tricarboxylate transporter TctB family protein n=1 Tax=Microbacterium sp. No. 7 TaxID=1714373 RepID=UPI0006ECD18F|nr:tripartite tricarboxylate transporter TctB family protein [Microbacterium sp. No. 7]ALJ19988.1 hypothetical protein AOA12_08735 [Microbacterium sp. No. 7]